MARRPEGPGPDGRGGYHVKIDGQRHPLGKDLDAAWTEFHRIMADRERARAEAKAPITIRAVAELFLKAAERRVVPLTLESYTDYARRFLAHVGKDIPAASLKPYHVSGWVAENPSWNPTTQRKAISLAKQMLRWAKRQGYLESDPFADIEKPAALSRESIMTEDQFQVLFARFRQQNFRDFLTAMRETGARPSEVMRLEARHIDWAARVAKMESKTSRRTRRIREIFLTDRMIELCRPLAEKWPVGPIFRNTRGNPWTRHAIAQRIGYHRKRLGFGREATAEAIRHGWITDGLEAGVPIATISTLAGHVDTTMVSRVYSKLHERKDHLREALDRVRPPEPPKD